MKNKEENRKLLIDCQYFGTITFIKTLFLFSNIEIEQYESYQKMSFRNRCRVAGSNGVVDLSVPLVKGRDQRELMKDVRISYTENWQVQHWRTIESCYSRAPFFEFYRDGLWQLLLGKPETYLLDLDLKILDWLQKVLKWESGITRTETYQKTVPAGVMDLRGHFLPRKPPEDDFGFRYTQVFEDRIGFQPHLSILDLLFCTGPAAKQLVQNGVLPI